MMMPLVTLMDPKLQQQFLKQSSTKKETEKVMQMKILLLMLTLTQSTMEKKFGLQLEFLM
jgi:hypothetical protein